MDVDVSKRDKGLAKLWAERFLAWAKKHGGEQESRLYRAILTWRNAVKVRGSLWLVIERQVTVRAIEEKIPPEEFVKRLFERRTSVAIMEYFRGKEK